LFARETISETGKMEKIEDLELLDLFWEDVEFEITSKEKK